MIHLTPQQISSYLDDELPDTSMELVRIHLSQCPDCTGRFARMEAQEETLLRVLSHDPGEERLENFVDDVLHGRPRAPCPTVRAALAVGETNAPGRPGRAAAIDAVRGNLVTAPPEGQRDSAWSWLARLKR